MARQNFDTYFEKYVNTKKGRNYVKGILALGCLRNGIADKVDRVVKDQFDGLVKIKIKKIKKLHQSDKLKCTKGPNAKCSDYMALCKVCREKFDEQMFCEIGNTVVGGNVCRTNSKGIANHCDFAKGFIQLGGYSEKKTIHEIDCSGLMKIVINNKAIQTYFGNIRIFEDVLKHRNNIHHNELTLDTESFNKALDAMSALLCEQNAMHHEEAMARQQQENTSEVHSKGEFQKNDLKIPEEESDLEVDACPDEYFRDKKKDDLATASYENNCSEMSQFDGLSKKMDEALEYLEELKRVNYHFSTNDKTEFLKYKSNSDKIEKLAKEMEIMKVRIAELENSKNGNSSCDVSDTANIAGEGLGQIHDTSNSSVCSSMPSKNWEDEIRRYETKLPVHLQLGYVDVLILHNEEDTESALKFKEHLQNDIKLDNGEKVKAILFHEITACGSTHFRQLEFGYARSTFIFIYVTKKFVLKKWDKFVAECCLTEMLNEDHDEVNVCAVYSEEPTFKIPLGLTALKRLDYYINDENYKNKVSMLISSKIGERKDKDEEHKIEQKEWIEKQKKKTNDIKKRQRQVELIE